MADMINSSEPHYRLYLATKTIGHIEFPDPTVVCVQQFDYGDYDDLMWLSDHGYATAREAWEALSFVLDELHGGPEQGLPPQVYAVRARAAAEEAPGVQQEGGVSRD